MIIRYKFVDGAVVEDEVEGFIGALIIKSRRLAGNCDGELPLYSLEAIQFDGAEYSGGGTFAAMEGDRYLYGALSPEVLAYCAEQQRLKKLKKEADGKDNCNSGNDWPIFGSPYERAEKRRVAAYARISTDHEGQLTSYGALVDYRTNYINR